MRIDTIVRALRVLLGTVTVVALFGVGGAVAATKFAQADLEDRAIESARKLATSAIEPVLQPRDADRPIRGTRYASLLAVVRRDVLSGPISGVTLWSDEGTVLFAQDRELVGETEGAMKQTIASIGRASAIGEVDGGRFLTLVPLDVANDGTSVTAELARPHQAIVAEAKERWWSWVGTAGRIAVVAFVLYLVVVGAGALLVAQRRRAAQNARDNRPVPGAAAAKERPKPSKPDARTRATSLLRRSTRSKVPAADKEPTASLKEAIAALEPVASAAPAAAEPARPGGNGAGGPAYLQPGFRDLEESRRKAEEALSASLQERARLEDRVRQLEGDLAEARRRLSMANAQ